MKMKYTVFLFIQLVGLCKSEHISAAERYEETFKTEDNLWSKIDKLEKRFTAMNLKLKEQLDETQTELSKTKEKLTVTNDDLASVKAELNEYRELFAKRSSRSLFADKVRRIEPARVKRFGEVYAFTAYLSNTVQNLNIGDVIVFDQVLTNEGHVYNPNTGIFTTPFDGTYVFHFAVADRHQHQFVGRLLVDGTNKVAAIADAQYSPHMDIEMQGGNMAVLSLFKGQRVWVESHRWDNQQIESGESDRFSTFSGFLLS
ncbi:otolin-1-like [Mya arenaria]|uniref:otolin-1-like n=1 Tax=Mya arenaria TaxID=6604 RepID=UPI0022E30063|nr:otolin-1-like [Mya arenaria]